MNQKIAVLKTRLLNGEMTKEEFVELANDKRKIVRQLIVSYRKKEEKKIKLHNQAILMQTFEKNLYQQGVSLIAGIDEAGRGPLAGPVVAAAVILPMGFFSVLIKDSKQLSAIQRENIAKLIRKEALAIGIGIIEASKIDELNIYQATICAMEQAVANLSIKGEHLLVDAMVLPNLAMPQTKIIKGDERSFSIAAASIIAKTTRDRMMCEFASIYPEYGFEQHKGYGTKQHLKALRTYGITPIHRCSFKPVKKVLTLKY